METSKRITVISRPGHSRDSLVALLRTIPQVEIHLFEGSGHMGVERLQKTPPDLILAELEAVDAGFADSLVCLKGDRPEIKCGIIVESLRKASFAQALGADCVFMKNIPAGVFIQAVRKLGGIQSLPDVGLPLYAELTTGMD
jgi:DNA-binding NarL/FixJ family response regulator